MMSLYKPIEKEIKKMSKLYKKAHNKERDDVDFKVTKNSNQWKFEFSLFWNKFKQVRLKFYNKTIEKLISLGVMNDSLGDPLAKLFLTKDKNTYQ